MSNKTPFEIRSEMLALAKDYLDNIQKTNIEFARQAFAAAVAATPAEAANWEKFVPKFYTFEDILTKAAEMYGFVSKK